MQLETHLTNIILLIRKSGLIIFTNRSTLYKQLYPMPRFAIHHLTKYTYEAPVRDSANQIVLFPIRDDFQEVLSQEIKITGDPDLEIFRDYHGNQVGSFMNAEPHTELLIDSKLQVVTKSRPMPVQNSGNSKSWDQLQAIKNLVPYIDFLYNEQFSALDELTDQISSKQFTEQTPLYAVQELNAYVFNH
jgi:transglutaminase-like putative cysteine protease